MSIDSASASIPSSSYNYNDYYNNPKSWQATNETTMSMNKDQGSDDSIKKVIDENDPDATKQTVS